MNPALPRKTIMADSCLSGGGGTDMVRCYQLVYSKAITETHHISTLEAMNCLVAMRTLLSSADRDSTIEVQCDSASTIAAFSAGRARDPVLSAVCRAAWYLSARMGIKVIYTHVPGALMDIPDALSRAHLGPEHRAKAQKIIRDNHLTIISAPKYATNYSNYM